MLLLALSLGAGRAGGELRFESRSEIDTPRRPTALALVDEDEGTVAVASREGVRLYRRSGSSMRAGSIVFSGTVTAMVSVDLDGDGIRELLLGETAPNRITLLHSPGADPAIAARVPLPDPPLALQSLPGTNVHLRTRRGIYAVRPGASTLEVVSRLAVEDLDGFVAGDLDGDGSADIIAHSGGEHWLVRSGADASSPEPFLEKVDATVQGLADVDGDARLDLLLIDAEGLHVVAAASVVSGTFDTPRLLLRAPHLASPVVTDLDADGDPDILVLDRARGLLIPLIRDGSRHRRSVSYVTGRDPSRLLIADLLADERSDVLVLNRAGDTVSLFPGSDPGPFQGLRAVDSGARSLLPSVVLDLDADGHTDALTASESDGVLIRLRGNGRGMLHVERTRPLARELKSFTAGHFDDDPLPDVAVTDFLRDRVLILFGSADGTFRVTSRVAVGAGPIALAAGDFRNRGVEDLAVAHLIDDSVIILYNDGRGRFDTRRTVAVRRQPRLLIVGDIDHDGRADVVVSDQRAPEVTILPGNGDGLGEPRLRDLGDRLHLLTSVDLDRDGHADLIALQRDGDAIDVLPGNESGGFGDAIHIPVAPRPTAAAGGDFDGDGLPDILLTHRDSGLITLLLNRSGARRDEKQNSEGKNQK